MTAVRCHVFVGTTAELIKLLPVISELKAKGVAFQIIASGQNDVRTSELWRLAGVAGPDVVLWDKAIRQSVVGLLGWFLRTLLAGAFGGKLRRAFAGAPRGAAYLIVHGDTVSTLLGSLLARWHGLRIAHVEAGLRSFNLLKPFPEEICRVLVSRIADLAFCPNAWAASNLKGRRLTCIDTGENTLADSLRLAMAQPRDEALFRRLPSQYFLAVLHRQENLFDRAFVTLVLGRVRQAAARLPCVFILHQLTKVSLEKLGLLRELESIPNVVLLERQPYVSFTQLLDQASFIMTDGGSNQEECYYLGKPCLILRSETERKEGLGANALLSNRDPGVIDRFLADVEAWRRPKVDPAVRPSVLIAATLAAQLKPG